jgi:hypothetical protein
LGNRLAAFDRHSAIEVGTIAVAWEHEFLAWNPRDGIQDHIVPDPLGAELLHQGTAPAGEIDIAGR